MMHSLDFGNAVAIDGTEVCLGINIDGAEIGVFYDTGGGSFPVYPGPYEYIPVFMDQVAPTEGKWMRQDVVFRAISVLEVSNPQGGITVTIGG